MPPKTHRKRDDKQLLAESEPLVNIKIEPIAVDDIEYVKLISYDGFEFIVRKDYALSSNTICTMLEAQSFLQGDTNVIEFLEIRGEILEKVCHYLSYRKAYHDSNDDIPQFPIENDIAVELLIAANFLDC